MTEHGQIEDMVFVFLGYLFSAIIISNILLYDNTISTNIEVTVIVHQKQTTVTILIWANGIIVLNKVPGCVALWRFLNCNGVFDGFKGELEPVITYIAGSDYCFNIPMCLPKLFVDLVSNEFNIMPFFTFGFTILTDPVEYQAFAVKMVPAIFKVGLLALWTSSRCFHCP